MESPTHNHITRDIKPHGKCPGCDAYHDKQDAKGSPFQGTRVESIDLLWRDDGVNGGYCPAVRDGQRTWMCRTPNGHYGNLGAHDVTEHEDGTITVSPSILVSNPQEGELFHGWLEQGVWRW